MNNDQYMDASLRTQACSLNYRNGNSRPEKDDVDKKTFCLRSSNHLKFQRSAFFNSLAFLFVILHFTNIFTINLHFEINKYRVVTLGVRATVIDTKRQSTPKKCKSGLKNCILDTF